jgi:hypothetical protein
VEIEVPPTVNVGEPTRIFILFTEKGEFVPIENVTIVSFQIFTAVGELIDIAPELIATVRNGWYYVDFAPMEPGHYSVVIVVVYGGEKYVATKSFSTAVSDEILSKIASFREELLVFLDKQFILTRDILGSAIGEGIARLSARLDSLDEKLDIIIASLDAVMESIKATIKSIEDVGSGVEITIKSIEALSETVGIGFSETTDALTSTIASSTDAIKGSVASSTHAIIETIRVSNDALQGSLTKLAEDISPVILPTGLGIALSIFLLAIIVIRQIRSR